MTWKIITALLIGYTVGYSVASGKPWLYVGPDGSKCDTALICLMLKDSRAQVTNTTPPAGTVDSPRS